jgi:hypothetical protein
MLLDGNVVIYATRPEHGSVREFIVEHDPAVSVVSMIEVLGYHALRPSDRALLEQYFHTAVVLPPSDEIAASRPSPATAKDELGRQHYRGNRDRHPSYAGDAQRVGFRWIDDLAVIDPLAAGT